MTITTTAPAGEPERDDAAALATYLESMTPDALAALNPSILAAAYAASMERTNVERAAVDASARIADAIRTAVEHVANLSAAATAAGLDAPDMSAVLAAAMERAAPVAPETLAAVIAPEPEPSSRTAGARRTRRRVERDWGNVPRGSIWTARLAGETGRVRIGFAAGRPTFTALTGSDLSTFASPSRAVQSACGNPAGAGRNDEATVNGFLALTRDGTTLDAATTAAASS